MKHEPFHLILDKVLAVKLIRNVRKQIIIINDCSKDGTDKVVGELYF